MVEKYLGPQHFGKADFFVSGTVSLKFWSKSMEVWKKEITGNFRKHLTFPSYFASFPLFFVLQDVSKQS